MRIYSLYTFYCEKIHNYSSSWELMRQKKVEIDLTLYFTRKAIYTQLQIVAHTFLRLPHNDFAKFEDNKRTSQHYSMKS